MPVRRAGPPIDALLRAVSDQFARGSLDRSPFTPALGAALSPAAVAQVRSLLAPLGKMTALTLTRVTPDGSALYRAVYGEAVVDWLIAVDRNGKITGLRLLPG